MRILFINDYESYGGAENYIKRVRENLENKNGFETRLIPTVDNLDLETSGILNYIQKLFAPRKRRELHNCIHEFNPDVIHVHNTHNATLPILRAISGSDAKVVKTFHDYSYYSICPGSIHKDKACNGNPEECLIESSISLKNYIFRKPLHFLRIRNLKIFDKLLAPSRDLSNLSSRFVETEFFPNFVDTSKYQYDKNIEREGLLFVGRVNEEKGIRFLLDIAAELPDKQFKVIGEGEIDKFREEAKKRNLENVKFLGYVSEQNLISNLQSSEMALIPSKWRENAPFTLLESLSCGTPVLVTRIGGMTSYIDEETGIVVDYGDTRTAVSEIEKYFESPNNYKERVRKRARELAECYSLEKHVKELIEKYNS